MREILFRGKCLYDGEWKEGFFGETTIIADETYISAIIHEKTGNLFGGDCYEVDAETVGQYTGLTDMHGTKIYEGDILSVTVQEKTVECGISKHTGKKIKAVWSVEYKERFSEGNGFYAYGKDRRFNIRLTQSVIFNVSPEVIGNIHDNPELMEQYGKRGINNVGS